MSMDCIKCGTRGECIDSRPSTAVQQATRRRYRCPNNKCGLRWSTLERVVGYNQRGHTAVDLENRLYKKDVLIGIKKTLDNMIEQIDVKTENPK